MSAVLLFLVAGCRQSADESPTSKPAIPAVDKHIRVGMKLDEAIALLRIHGAQETGFQLAHTNPANEIHWFALPTRRVIELVAQSDARNESRIKSISISTYEPKSWDSKLDPERDKFFNSFKRIDEYDLNQPSEAQLSPTTTKAQP